MDRASLAVNTVIVSFLEALRVGVFLTEGPFLEQLKAALNAASFGIVLIAMAISKLLALEHQLNSIMGLLNMFLNAVPTVKIFTETWMFVKDDNRFVCTYH
uniref:Nucleos_tra2_C domain-containing protein n=1 Tax=Steinernema glaseri TaxID=37863 RepID=A0A1I7YUW4_9BILA